MKKQVEKLRLARERLQHSIDAAIRNGEAIEGVVDNWLKEVDEITELAMKVVEGEEEAKTRRSDAAACLDLKLRHQLSHKAKKIAQAMDEVLENCKFDKVSYRPAPQGRLIEAQRDDNIHVIGVWGMAGVGKSTLVREVANQAKEEKLFDDVAIANVAHSPDLTQIQREIANMLDLKFYVESSVIGRAICLRQRLTRTKDKKMILVILDDICEMGTQKNFGLKVLLEEEAWSLFKKLASDCVKDPNWGSIATEVAKECEGLPLALVTVSKALKNKELYGWKNALQLLRNPALRGLTTMQSKIYYSIELSYEHLETSRDHNMFVARVDHGGLIEWPDANALKRCEAFSFQGMRKLKVLDLTKMQLSSLPSSLRLLENLQTLCLDQCVLEDISVIGKLTNLAILSLHASEISQLPREMGFLTCLRLLNLSDCSKFEVIPPNVLSSLVALEELYMGNSFVQWEVEGLNNASLAELKHLSHLSTLNIHIPNASNLPKDLLFEKLQRYVIFVGDKWDWSDGQEEASTTLKLKLYTSFQLEGGIKMLLNRTENLYLDELKGIKSVLHGLNREGFQQLKHLYIQNNPEIKYIINLKMSVIAFPTLETFHLKNMTGLEEICHGQLPNLTSFGKLRVVKVEHCDKLKYLFSSSIAKVLSQLKELEIGECSIMVAIVMKEEGKMEDKDTASLFPQLCRLGLKHLPKLMSFLSTQKSLVIDVGEITMEGKPDFHMPILHEHVVFPNLERLEPSSIGLEDIQGNQRQASRYMGQLKYLSILECEVMEEILVTEDLGVVEETTPNVLFPLLELLVLSELPMLKRLCEGSNIKFPSLKFLWIEKCPNLKTFISKPVSLDMTTSCKELKEINAAESPHTAMQPLFNEEVAFPCLERLAIARTDTLKEIWWNQFAVDSFYKLQDLTVISCENLVNIFRSDMLERFKSLEELTVGDCGSLQEVFEVQGINAKETQVVTSKEPKPIFSFQNLRRVHVSRCRNLKSLFPAFVATCLTQLEKLVMVDCKVLEEIVAGNEAEQPIAKLVFSRVTVLHLVQLPFLRWFYPGVHTSEWPKLKNMLVAKCPRVEIFASGLSSFQDILGQSHVEIPIKQPLFLVDDEVSIFPSLEKLRIFCMADLKIIWHGQFNADSFGKPEAMKVEFCENLIDPQKTCGVTATQLKELHLLHLPQLKHVWSMDPHETFSFQSPLDSDEAMKFFKLQIHSMESPPISVEYESSYTVKAIVLSYQNSGASPEERIIEIGYC
ncbi:hypothetical protein FH972_006505 [Carpinus fangiana]|uniref:NB-ARC domain-containing protein n=1 Tax=Carpinus fangiana TaxID=176857 RepID=A0A5N6QVZ6_9ROSI|nr:hypothetical protein FH972_006505 [Carpinus fangiana]